ncbi:MAG: hypothetical protein OXI37_09015 [Gammaproteobacteria bacterium]|nr:hypothetical protein [Gammaproteobacteria bacterium]
MSRKHVLRLVSGPMHSCEPWRAIKAVGFIHLQAGALGRELDQENETESGLAPKPAH